MFKLVDGAEKEEKSLAVLFLSYGTGFFFLSPYRFGVGVLIRENTYRSFPKRGLPSTIGASCCVAQSCHS